MEEAENAAEASAQLEADAELDFVEHCVWQIDKSTRLDFLEIFTGKATASAECAGNGLRVGQPIDINTGFDLLTEKGRNDTWRIIKEQNPLVAFMAPVCTPWSKMQDLNDQVTVRLKRRENLPLVRFCKEEVAEHRMALKRFFIIENPLTLEDMVQPTLQILGIIGKGFDGTILTCAATD